MEIKFPLFEKIYSLERTAIIFDYLNKNLPLKDRIQDLLNRLTLEEAYFFGVHPSNVLPMRGLLPRDREAMLDAIREMRAHMGSRLNERPIRTGEGGILNRG